MKNIARHVRQMPPKPAAVTKTVQSVQTPLNKRQVLNNTGGYTFQLDPFKMLERFLIIGSEGGTFYATESKLTRENATCVDSCLAINPARTVAAIKAISESGRAPKNDAAIFALALAASHSDDAARAYAFGAMPAVCRIGTHLFQFVQFSKELRGWGRGLKNAVADWYAKQPVDKVAYQIVKYPHRAGFTHRDLIHMSRPMRRAGGDGFRSLGLTLGLTANPAETANRITKADFKYIPHVYEGAMALQAAQDVHEAARIVYDYNLPREAVESANTAWLNEPVMWDALLCQNHGMPLGAMVRNLAKMTAIEYLMPLAGSVSLICSRLTDREELKRARIHPMNLLSALRVYTQGHGDKGSLKWTPVQQISAALEEAFYLAFDYVEPAGKNRMVALDISGSMQATCPGLNNITCREASAVLAMVTLATEPNTFIVGFHNNLIPLNIKRGDRLNNVVSYIDGLGFGSTRIGAPMEYAMQNRLDVDAFEIYTDNEVNTGIHPMMALRDYRGASGKADAKLVVCAMTPTRFTVADPNDANTLDVVGMDTATPALITRFVAGQI